MYYEKFSELLQRDNITAYRVGKDLNISYSILSEWKSGIKTPKLDKLKKIADYFGVSVDYLIDSDDIKNEPALEPNSFASDYFSLDKEDKETVDLLISSLLQKEKYKKDKNVG